LDWAGTPEFARQVVSQSGAKLAILASERSSLDLGVPVLRLESLVQDLAAPPRVASSSVRVELDRNSLAEIVFTSGTTSEPKGVAISHGNILANLEPIEREILRFRKYERFVHPIRFLNLLPLSHVFGQFLGLFLPPVMGGEVHFQESLSPAEIARTIRRQRISVLVAVPRVLDSLRRKIENDAAQLRGPDWLPQQLRSAQGERFWHRWWRFRSIHRQLGWKFWAIISGGAALSRETEEFWNRIGIAVIQGYGLTETTSMITLNHPFAMGRGSIGKVLPGREVRLAEDGEILVRGESVATGYWKDAGSATATGSGWFHTGDIGAFDAEGNLYFKGRKKNVIVTPAGMNIFPEDLEAALRRQPGIRDCVVFPLASQGDTEAAAVLLVQDSSDPQSLIDRANSHLAEYQRIRRWFVWPDADFPRTSTGKSKIAEIAERISAQPAESATGRPTEVASRADRDLSAILSHITGRTLGSLQPAARLESDLGLSSLDRVELLSALEDRFQLSLNEAAISGDSTVADLERLISTSNQAPSAPSSAAAAAAPVQSASSAPQIAAEALDEFPAAQKLDVFPRWTQHWPATWIRAAVYTLLTWPATHLLAHPRVSGRENLRGYRRPLLIVSNHVTPEDIGFIAAALPPRYRYRLAVAMAGERLRSYRFPPKARGFFGRLLDRTNYILVTLLFNVFPLPRVSGFRESFRYVGESVDRGFCVVVFPEGRTTPDGKIQPFRGGIGLLAANLRIPVLPVRFDGLYELREAHRIWAGWNRVRVSLGIPLEFPSETSATEITHRLETSVAALSDGK
ncbi:MAG TPA: AMP-binding protein, partial [Candidatus Acidoferrales bacterium]|nr:AMP-binding protein [Candidatus Acidoferrales bacterium]